MSELLKAQLVQGSPKRSQDALHGVADSEHQQATENITVGPYTREELYTPDVRAFLHDPQRATVVLCGRNEFERGNLPPLLNYALQSTETPDNIVYVDGNSTDQSVPYVKSVGVTVLTRDNLLDAVDKPQLAAILAVSPEVLEGKDVAGQPPLRKGAELLNIRRYMLEKALRGEQSTYMMYIDTDLKSIPGGGIAEQLPSTGIYHPLQLLTKATLELEGEQQKLAIFTGSGERNNEPIFTAHNLFAVHAASPLLTERQRKIAESYFTLPSQIVHPLTGELGVATEAELHALAATGQSIEVARILSLAGFDYHAREQSGSLHKSPSSIGNVRRGEQQRIDEPQVAEKEWWMITGIIPQFAEVIAQYSLSQEKLPHELTLEDYAKINHWLAKVQDVSLLNSRRQTRAFKRSPMERVVPPVTMLHKEGLLTT